MPRIAIVTALTDTFSRIQEELLEIRLRRRTAILGDLAALHVFGNGTARILFLPGGGEPRGVICLLRLITDFRSVSPGLR